MAATPFPSLIAHTPRAGRWNHVALLPPGGVPAGTDAGAFLGLPEGPGMSSVTVSVEVQQPTTGRTGREVLVLIGVSVPDGDRLGALQNWLRERLVELGPAVAAFDWDSHRGGPAVVPQLAAWRDRAVAEFGLVPHNTPRPGLSRRAGLLVMALAGTGTALLTAGLIRRFGR